MSSPLFFSFLYTLSLLSRSSYTPPLKLLNPTSPWNLPRRPRLPVQYPVSISPIRSPTPSSCSPERQSTLGLPLPRNNTSAQSLATSFRRPSGPQSSLSRLETNRTSRLRFETCTFSPTFLSVSDSNLPQNSSPTRPRTPGDDAPPPLPWWFFRTPSRSSPESPLDYSSSPEEVTRSSRTTPTGLSQPLLSETSKTRSFGRYSWMFSAQTETEEMVSRFATLSRWKGLSVPTCTSK
mmetsp:Transcript_62/g.168  ORF Transcript_62/g.168 Transcript_62/m.168 type:complete len:236 (+) Transcript_62:3254-3961(+)